MQRAVTSPKKFYYDTKVKGLKDSKVEKWWKNVKNLAGISDDSGQWYRQLDDVDVIDSVATPCYRINDFFVHLTLESVPLTPDDVAGIKVESILRELLTTLWEAEKALRGIKIKNEAPGPDGVPNAVLKKFALGSNLARSSVTFVICFTSAELSSEPVEERGSETSPAAEACEVC